MTVRKIPYPNKQFTDDFLLVRLPDVAACEEDRLALRDLDTRITIDCTENPISFARIALIGEAPDICMRIGIAAGPDDPAFIFELVHELGHAFGLADTYGRKQSTGGLAFTIGKQPASVMAGRFPGVLPFALGEDDKNGIIYLYKYLYEEHAAGDCFFPDYVRIEWNGRCRPEYPLIFEAKHGTLHTVREILIDDPTLDVNARDSQGMSALHYAVQRGSAEMVKMLLAQAGIKVNITNKNKRTPVQLAWHLKLVGFIQMVQLIEKHPTAKLRPWSVDPAQSLTTTWGALKRAR